jgi:hypothetical protein
MNLARTKFPAIAPIRDAFTLKASAMPPIIRFPPAVRTGLTGLFLYASLGELGKRVA